MRGVHVSASVRRLPIEGGLLLFDASGNNLFAFNETAGHAWDLLAAGRCDEELVNEFAAWWGIPAARAGSDLSAILAQWGRLGLVTGPDFASAPALVRPGSTQVSVAQSCRSQSISAWTCTIRGISIAFAIEGQFGQTIRSLFQQLENPDAVPETRLEVRPVAGDEMVLLTDGTERIRTADSGQLVGAVYQTVLERIHPGINWLAIIHGAAVAHRGAGLALPGPSGSGKSTLAAALLAAGYDYLADDMIALAAPDGAILPWPLPLSIKPGSITAVAAQYPELAEAPSYRTKGVDARLLIPPMTAWDAAPTSLRFLIFPRFSAGASAELRRISAFEAVKQLLADRIWFGYPITEARVTAFLNRLNDSAAYALTYGELGQAVRLVEQVAR